MLAHAPSPPGGRYSYAHAAVAEHPAPIEAQIRRIVAELERFSRHRQRMIDAGRWHPHVGADVIYELRSVLHTLRQVEAQVEATIARGTDMTAIITNTGSTPRVATGDGSPTHCWSTRR